VQFEKTSTSYAIEIGDEDFSALLDSESYVTDNAAYKAGAATLGEKLDRQTPARNVDYNGHFGAHVFLSLDADDDTEATRLAIKVLILDHLRWCRTLKKKVRR
jgi:hypothetical protein